MGTIGDANMPDVDLEIVPRHALAVLHLWGKGPLTAIYGIGCEMALACKRDSQTFLRIHMNGNTVLIE